MSTSAAPGHAGIAVLVGWHEHAVSGRAVCNRGDVAAVMLALAQGSAQAVRLLSVGVMPELVARAYLALGAPAIDVLETNPASAAAAAAVLTPEVTGSMLVLTGMRAEGGLATGLLPYEMAARLRRPLLPDVLALAADGDAWIATQALPRGARRRLRITVPAVLAVHAQALVQLRHAHRDMVAGQVRRHPAAACAIEPQADAAGWRWVATQRQLQPLRAARRQSGHGRMLDAIHHDNGNAAGTVLADTSVDAQARAVFDYLLRHALLRP